MKTNQNILKAVKRISQTLYIKYLSSDEIEEFACRQEASWRQLIKRVKNLVLEDKSTNIIVIFC